MGAGSANGRRAGRTLYGAVALWLTVAVAGVRGAEYFVGKEGDDANPGTRLRPFRTIQQAATVMAPGDTCLVGRGLYRETVRPRNSGKLGKPLQFRAQPGETVTVSGADEITGWTRETGAIYRVTATNVIQVLVDDGPARRVSGRPAESLEPAAAWGWDGGSNLWARFPRNDAPVGHKVEVQTRAWGFDFTGLTGIEVEGFNLSACGLSLAGARHCRIADCHLWWGASGADAGAIIVGGEDNEIHDCSMVGSLQAALVLTPDGMNNRVRNCLIRGVEVFAGSRGIVASGTAPVIRNLTVLDCGGGALVCSNSFNARIEANDFAGGRVTPPGGALVVLAGDGKGTVLAGNWIHDQAGTGGCGVQLAGGLENYVLRQNVIWGHDGAAFSFGSPARFVFVMNNTCALNGSAVEARQGSDGTLNLEGTRIVNNILAGAIWPSSGGQPPAGVVWENNFTGADPGFVDVTNRNFQLRQGSPCIDAGQEEPEFTDEFSGPHPDRGAYEFGREYAPPGCRVTEGANRVGKPVVKLLFETPSQGAELRYTLDGRQPESGSALYTGPVGIVQGATVRVRAFRNGMEASPTTTVAVRVTE